VQCTVRDRMQNSDYTTCFVTLASQIEQSDVLLRSVVRLYNHRNSSRHGTTCCMLTTKEGSHLSTPSLQEQEGDAPGRMLQKGVVPAEHWASDRHDPAGTAAAWLDAAAAGLVALRPVAEQRST
jgi:hypothetical protein